MPPILPPAPPTHATKSRFYSFPGRVYRAARRNDEFEVNTAANHRMIPTAVMALSVILAAALFLRSHSQSGDTTTLPAAQPVTPASRNLLARPRVNVLEESRISRRVALDETLGELDPQRRSIAFGQLLALWLDEDLEGALAYVRGLPQSAQYNEGLFMVLERIGRSDPERAVTLASEMANTSEQLQIYSALFGQMARRDLTTAVNILALTPAGEGRDNALHAVASAWAERDVNAALNWAQSLTDTNERSTALEISLSTLAGQDPQRAFTLAAQSLNGEALERVATAGLKQMLQNDPQTVSELVARLPSGEMQTQVTLDVARVLTAQQPETALAWLPSLPSGQLRQAALNNVLDLWQAQNPADAALYVSQMPAGADQDSAISHLSHALGVTNPTDALQWAGSLPDDSARDAAVVNIVSGWAEHDPAAATLWAQNLTTDNPMRLAAMRGAYSYWELTDASAAMSFANSLPQAEQLRLLGK